jgi:hypothetical protein
MAKWETCEIVLCRVREYKVKGGFFSTTVIPGIDQWEARKIGVSGSQTIYESEEWQCGPPYGDWSREEVEAEYENSEREYQKMISHLLNEGWESAATNEDGGITLMKRQIIEAEPQAATDPVNLLKQLANLHDGGILTDQEFQAKKAELLKRM